MFVFFQNLPLNFEPLVRGWPLGEGISVRSLRRGPGRTQATFIQASWFTELVTSDA